MRKYRKSYQSPKHNSCGVCNNTCVVKGEVVGEIEIGGEGVRGMLAEIFLAGGTIDLALAIDVASECGSEDRVMIGAEGEAIAVANS